ncbi:unnamed protein product [Rotaria sordida]|uniref:Uncharacterized protein n=1 Tax=Rotaria sordida TaxID=392033 RepID=A0A815YJY9_9BILA|nr:unnamed protein product [Rotaria sordida]CAF1571961.1 unnamed protein product [Rotaria sordida]
MSSNNYKNEIIDDNDNQRFHRIRTEWFHKTQQPTVPNLYEQTITTTTTTIDKELNSTTDEMTTTHLEKSPIRRVNLVTGPQSAFARLFPDKYRQEQEELARRQRSKSSDDQRYNFDRVKYQQIPCNNNDNEIITRTRQVSFFDEYNNEFSSDQNLLNTRTKSESYINENLTHMPLNYDPDPEIIYRDNPDKVVYIQKIGVRYLKPPTPPPPEPIIVREIQSTPPQEPPPLVVSSTPPIIPRTPSPLIVREQPPTPPQHQPAKIITKTLPRPPTPPRRVIIKRIPPLPAKPRPVIIEKWLPYKTPPERAVIYERAQQSEQIRQIPRNVILQYDQAKVRIEQEIQNVGCFRVDPEIYRAQFGTSLRRTDSIRKVLQDIGCNPDLITSTKYKAYCSSNRDNYLLPSSSSPYDYQKRTTCFSDEQFSELIGSTTNINHHYDIPSTSNNQNKIYYSTVLSNS